MAIVAGSLWEGRGTSVHILSLSPNQSHVDIVYQFWRKAPIFFPLKETPDRIPHSCHQAFSVLVKVILKQRLGFIHETQDPGHLSPSLLTPGHVWEPHNHKHRTQPLPLSPPPFPCEAYLGKIDKLLVVTLRNPHSKSAWLYRFILPVTH